MKLKGTCLLLCLGLLAGCTISDNEQQGLDAVEKVYGGKVSFKIGTFASTIPNAAQGKQLEIDLTDADLTRYGGMLGLPASNSALLLYRQMTAAERAEYNGLRVVLQNGDSSRTYSYKMSLLAQAEQAHRHLQIVLDGWRQRDYQAVADRWNQVALRGPDRSGLTDEVARQGEKIGGIVSYTPEGFAQGEVPVNGRSETLMNVYVTIAAPTGSTRQMMFCLNPQMRANEQFLYGMQFLQPPFRDM